MARLRLHRCLSPRLTAVVLALLLAGAALAAEPSVTVSVDREEVPLDEAILLTVTVQGSRDAAQPALPQLPDLDIVSQSSSQSISVTGGATSVGVSYEYTLRPRSEGTKTIPPIEVQVGRRVLKTRPLTVKVLLAQAGGPSAPPDLAPFLPADETPADALARCEVDKQRAYVGEQILLTFSFLSTGPVQGADYQPPRTEGFRTKDLPAPPARYETVNGRQYVVRQALKLLFPTAPGKFVLGPATVQYSRGLWEPTAATLATEPINIEVVRLPLEGRPDNFSGVVGHLEVRTQLDRPEIKRGEAATLTTIVSGWGDLEVMRPPALVLPPGLRRYRSTESRDFGPVQHDGGYRMEGRALYDTVIVPTTVGDLTIPGAALAYFDPSAGAYRVARSEPLVLRVAPGVVGELPEVGGPAATGRLRPLPDRLVARRTEALLPAPVLLAQVLVVGWLIGALWVRRRRAILAADPKLARAHGAVRRARAQVKAAAGLPPRESAAQVAAAVAGYLADRLDVPAATVSAASAEPWLAEVGVSAEAARSLADLLRQCDRLRFAPPSAAASPAAEALELLRRLEAELGRRRAPSAREEPAP